MDHEAMTMSAKRPLTPAEDLVAAAGAAILAAEAVADTLDADLAECDEPSIVGSLRWQISTLRVAAERLRAAETAVFEARVAGEPGA